jgi:hypothetical protein
MAQKPLVGQDLLLIEASQLHLVKVACNITSMSPRLWSLLIKGASDV